MGAEADWVVHEEFIESTKCHRLFMRSWTPAEAPRAMLAVAHGFHSHSAYYERFAAAMGRRGIATCAIDLRGRGRSSGTRYFVRRFAEYVDDVAALVSLIHARQPTLPLFLLGHDAGGVAACLHAIADRRNLAGLICESLVLEAPTSALKVRLLKTLAVVAPRLPAMRWRNALFSRDEAMLDRMNADDLIRHERQPARTAAEHRRACSDLRATLEDIALPLLILHGSADRIALPSGSEFFHEAAGSRDKTLQIFEGYCHDLINDRGHEHVVARIHEWIQARLGGTGERAQIGISFINNGS